MFFWIRIAVFVTLNENLILFEILLNFLNPVIKFR